jgi:hypothetical protein
MPVAVFIEFAYFTEDVPDLNSYEGQEEKEP